MKNKKEQIMKKCLDEDIYVEERMTKAAMLMLLHEKQEQKVEEDRRTAQSSRLHKGKVMTEPPGMGSSSSAGATGTGPTSRTSEERSNKQKGEDLQAKEMAETKKELHAAQAKLNRMREKNPSMSQ